MVLSEALSPADAAILETFVVPRYLALFGDLLLEMILIGDSARIAHIGCRTGYPDLKLYQRVDGVDIVGIDSSLPALELARNKAAVLGDIAVQYRFDESLPLDLESGSFTHAYALHPIAGARERAELFAEISRLLSEGGQALVALPLRGSFQEIADLFREYALKYEDGEFSKTI